MAFGARPSNVAQSIAAPMLGLVSIGVAFGLAGSIATATLLRNLLFAVSPLDPTTQLISAVAVTFCSILAALGPVSRAMRLNPSDVLRC